MAKLIDDLMPKRPGRQQFYPWDEWTDGRARLLTKGEDFNCSAHSLRPYLYKKAAELGKRVICEIRSEDSVAIQFLDD